MTSYKFGDIILVPFPFTDQTSTKKRPAVLISKQLPLPHFPIAFSLK
jgi:mRNA interferase MazF